MASEAKIGLLLGLVIIFIVAFVINGLPRFGSVDNNDDLTNVMDGNPPGIRPGMPRKVLVSAQTHDPITTEAQLDLEDDESLHDSLPATVSPTEVANQVETDAPEGNSEIMKLEPVKPAWPKVHIVNKGDCLGDIAKLYYGSKEGNRKANVLRIYRANRNVLKSPDKIFPGQKLIIPSLWASGANQNTIERIFPDSMFELVDSIGRRHL